MPKTIFVIHLKLKLCSTSPKFYMKNLFNIIVNTMKITCSHIIRITVCKLSIQSQIIKTNFIIKETNIYEVNEKNLLSAFCTR